MLCPDCHKRVRIEVKRVFASDREAGRFRRWIAARVASALAEWDRGRGASIAEHLEAWLSLLADEGKTETHLIAARRKLRDFLVFTDSDGWLAEVTAETVRAWRHSLLTRKLGAGTANGYVAELKAFANWAAREELWEPDARAVRWLKLARLGHRPKQPAVYTPAELGRLLSRLPRQIRNPMVFQYASCDRPGAWYALSWRDIHWPDTRADNLSLVGLADLRVRKGGRPSAARFAPGGAVHAALLDAREFFRERTGRAPVWRDPVFVSARTGERWTGPSFGSALRYHLARLGERPTCPYSLRHSVGVNMLRGGLDSFTTQAGLGHADFKSTANYIHLTGGDRERAQALAEEQLAPFLRGLSGEKTAQ